MNSLKLVLVAANMSQRMGGEAGKNLIYFRKLREKNVDVWVVCHSRTRTELREVLAPEEFERITFTEDTSLQALIWQSGRNLPSRIRELMVDQLVTLVTETTTRRVVRDLIADKKIQCVFQPTPNTPRAPSAMYGLGVPVVIGPLKGGMKFPPAFQFMDTSLTRNILAIGKFASGALHELFPGKRFADVLLVGDEETRKLLPRECRGRVYEVFECGVDLKVWHAQKPPRSGTNQVTRFVFTGRLVDWKGVQFLLEAFQTVTAQIDASLEIVGDGHLRQPLEAQAEMLGIRDRVHFHGLLKRDAIIKLLLECDVFVMPSLRESCGNSILEAMALGLPVIATRWGGPTRILDSTCGVLIEPSSRAAFVEGLAKAMIDLANAPELRQRMGDIGKQRLTDKNFDWDSKVERIIEICREAVQQPRTEAVKQNQFEPSPQQPAERY